jgi:hypothetical protein
MSYAGDTARLIVVTAIALALALAGTSVLNALLGPPVAIAVLL